MSEQENIEALAEVFEKDAGEISRETQLDELGWDSMSILSVMALSKMHGKGLTGDQVRTLKTVGDVLAYL